MFGFLVPFVALYFGTATIRDEYEGGTLPYLLTRPISRTVLLSGRLMAAILTVFTILAVTQAINIWILGQGVSNHRLGAIFFALFLASVAYSSVFATLGAALSRPFLFGVIYLLLVEFTLMQMPVSARFATLGAHVANVAGFTVEPSQIGFDAYNLAASTSLGVICGVTMLAYVIAVIVFNRRQYLN
jgi:ABC-2 type transport system permease protein